MDDYEPEHITKEDAYMLVVNARRRRVLRVLLENPREWPVKALARAVVAREQECSTAEVGEQRHRQVLLSLVHNDLPKLAAEDMVVFEDETVTPGEYIDDLAPLVK